MKKVFSVYEVWAETRDPYTGNRNGRERKKVFASLPVAENYKKTWEAKYKYNCDNNIAAAPCWIDYEPTLEIKEVPVFDE